MLRRLPGDLRVAPTDAAQLISERFGAPLLLGADTASHLPRLLAAHAVAGGAVYDALVALAAAGHGATLATRDIRARSTYEALGVDVVLAG